MGGIKLDRFTWPRRSLLLPEYPQRQAVHAANSGHMPISGIGRRPNCSVELRRSTALLLYIARRRAIPTGYRTSVAVLLVASASSVPSFPVGRRGQPHGDPRSVESPATPDDQPVTRRLVDSVGNHGADRDLAIDESVAVGTGFFTTRCATRHRYADDPTRISYSGARPGSTTKLAHR